MISLWTDGGSFPHELKRQDNATVRILYVINTVPRGTCEVAWTGVALSGWREWLRWSGTERVAWVAWVARVEWLVWVARVEWLAWVT